MSASADEPELTCRECGTPIRRAGDLAGQCFVCLLASALEEEEVPMATPERFDHYQVITDADGNPVELGRGAMGVTYKAFDVDLRCPVTLKVISERYLGDESARLRFLREARAAASVRHPNVASVFHLGRTGENYFYAMEFVAGETLANLIKHSRPPRGNAGAGNRDAGDCRIGRNSRAEPRPPRYQANKHHGEVEGGAKCNGKNHRSRPGEDTRRIGF